jgi:predicted AlkP superfamily pyrophosphatase or phosphodiesterase
LGDSGKGRGKGRRGAAIAATSFALILAACSHAPRTASPAASQSVVLISIDGFRADYLDQYAPPHLLDIARRGVRARWLQPATPTLTFPNHYSIATGLYPAHHGIVNNHFRDPVDSAWFHYNDSMLVRQSRWWGGEPLWVTAEKQGVRAGSYFWVGSEASIEGVRPTFSKHFRELPPGAERADTVLAWLTRPDSLRVRLALLYFSAVDHMAHDSGPGSPAVHAAILGVDSAIGRLVGGIEAAGLGDRVNVIVVSDHGMAPTDSAHAIVVDDYIDPARYEAASLSPFLAVRPLDGNIPAALAALRRIPHLTVFPIDSTPAYWHYRSNPRMAPIVGVFDQGWVANTRDFFRRHPPRKHGGEHGYDVSVPAMHALFVAEGPAFRHGHLVPPFGNIHVYDLICRILGLAPAPNDGSPDSTRALLAP